MPDVNKACERFEQLGVEFVKKPDAGTMKGLAFIKVLCRCYFEAIRLHISFDIQCIMCVQDPDGYWIEILNGQNSQKLV